LSESFSVTAWCGHAHTPVVLVWHSKRRLTRRRRRRNS